MTTETHVVDDAVSDGNISAALHVDNLVYGIHSVSSAIKRHVSSAAVHKLLVLKNAVISHTHTRTRTHTRKLISDLFPTT